MPLTPFHLGPGLFFGMLLLRVFNLFAFLAGSVIMDIEPIVLIFVKKCYLSCPHHSFFHSILGALVGSIAVALILKIFARPLEKFSLKLKIKQSFSFPILFLSSFSAWFLHIFFDSLTHFDVFPFWPSKYNPFLIGRQIYWQLCAILVLIGILGLILFYKHYVRHKLHSSEPTKD